MRGAIGRSGVAVFGVAVTLAACATAPVVEEGATPSGDLAATIAVETGADSVVLRLHVTNVSDGPVELEFTSGQRYDFQVATEAGETLWTWSADRSFMQALGAETIGAGESLTYSAAWPSGGRTGRFVGIGMVTSTNEPLRQSVVFELTGDE